MVLLFLGWFFNLSCSMKRLRAGFPSLSESRQADVNPIISDGSILSGLPPLLSAYSAWLMSVSKRIKASIIARPTASAISGDKPASAAQSRRSAITCATRSGAATACLLHLLLTLRQQDNQFLIQLVYISAHFRQCRTHHWLSTASAYQA